MAFKEDVIEHEGKLALAILYSSIIDMASDNKEVSKEAINWLSKKYDKQLDKEGKMSFSRVIRVLSELGASFKSIFGVAGEFSEIPYILKKDAGRQILAANISSLAMLFESGSVDISVADRGGKFRRIVRNSKATSLILDKKYKNQPIQIGLV